ncbi:MAG: transcription termination factor Rho [Puniceicoccales bacterium]|jgi:transcription termination factor Rho|nr:transcription termination factor Rho [Puniceicoccales bacterium]
MSENPEEKPAVLSGNEGVIAEKKPRARRTPKSVIESKPSVTTEANVQMVENESVKASTTFASDNTHAIVSTAKGSCACNKHFHHNQKHSNGDRGYARSNGGNGAKRSSTNNVQIPPNVQRFRWWMGQLYQWRNIGDIASLEHLVQEITDVSLESFSLNAWYEKPLKLLLEKIPQEAQLLSLTRQSILAEKMREACDKKTPVIVEGVVAKVPNTDEWSVCYPADNYQLRELSSYLPKALVRKYGLRQGQMVQGQIFMSPTYQQCPCIVKINSVMNQSPEAIRTLPHFKELVPYYPTQRILLETENVRQWDNVSMRIVDLLTPIGFGQRGLIVAPPRTGKTVLLQNVANSIVKNQPAAHLIVLLIDERPEEVTDFKNLLPGIEVISSTFDEAPESHVRAAEIVIEKAKRLVEIGENVVILLDSITRLARAYNTIIPSSGKVLSGGVEANALQGPKAFFGAARNIEQGGSLTILATALVDTGSKMDEVIFEEFKGTGNMELHLDRSLTDKRIFPAINIEKSGTRKEELLYHPDEVLKIYSLRRAMKGVIPSSESMEMLLDRIKKTRNNVEFLMSLNT